MSKTVKHKYYFERNGAVIHAQDEYSDRCGGQMVLRSYAPGFLVCDKCGHQEGAAELIERRDACSGCSSCSCGGKK